MTIYANISRVNTSTGFANVLLLLLTRMRDSVTLKIHAARQNNQLTQKTVINAWIIWLNDFWIYFQPWVIITLSQKYFLTITNSIVLVSTLELRFWCLLFNLSCGTLFNSAFSRRIFNCCCSEDLESIDFFRGEG